MKACKRRAHRAMIKHQKLEWGIGEIKTATSITPAFQELPKAAVVPANELGPTLLAQDYINQSHCSAKFFCTVGRSFDPCEPTLKYLADDHAPVHYTLKSMPGTDDGMITCSGSTRTTFLQGDDWSLVNTEVDAIWKQVRWKKIGAAKAQNMIDELLSNYFE